MTFFGLHAWLGAVAGGARATLPGTGTRLSALAIELPQSITPTIAGLAVGGFVGVVGFIAVMLLVGRPHRRRSRRMRVGADRVVFIPPYGTMQRDTPLPPRAFAIAPPSSGNQPVAAPYAQVQTQGHAYAPDFRPSTALSARAFARMGQAADETPGYSDAASGISEPDLSVDVELESDRVLPSSMSAVTVAPVVVLSTDKAETSAPVQSADKSAPHPLGIIKSSSTAMRAPAPSLPAPLRAASIADLAYDDSPTEIGETYFDEPPQPRRRSDPPKIRPKTPAPPRFPEQAQPLPRVTPPRSRAASGHRG